MKKKNQEVDRKNRGYTRKKSSSGREETYWKWVLRLANKVEIFSFKLILPKSQCNILAAELIRI